MKLSRRPTESTANVLTGQFQSPITGPIMLYDNTLREGEQPPGVVFTADEKLEIARAMDEFGVPWANVGFPAASKEEFESVHRITKAGLKMKTAALCRLADADIDQTAESGVAMIALFAGGSDTHLRDKLRWTEADAIEKIEASVRRCKERGVLASFAVEDGSRTPLTRLLKFYQVAEEAGADYLVVADTAGVLTPTSTYRIMTILKSLLKTPLGSHFHNDLGLANANTLSALEAGAEMAQVTLNGAGERSGNTCLEELVVALKVKYGRDLGLKLDKLHALCDLVHKASGTRPSEHKAITGRWCFTHESGIHVAGILANPETYQAFPPDMIGRQHEIVFGKHSGAQGLLYLAKQAGLKLSDSARKTVLARLKSHAERKQQPVTEEQILAWIKDEEGA